MSAYGIAGLVDGFIRGREVKNSWQDRKDNKARQAKLDEFYAQEQGRRAEEHGWRRDEYGRKISAYDQQQADDKARREAGQAAIDATDAALAGDDGYSTSTMGAVPPASAPVQPASQTQNAAQLPAAVNAATRTSPAVEQFERFFDPNSLGAVPRSAQPASAPVPSAMPEDTRGQAIAENRASTQQADAQAQLAEVVRENEMLRQEVAKARGGSAVPPMNMPENPRLQTQGPGPGGGMQDLYDQGILPRRYVEDNLAPQAAAPEATGPRQRGPMENFASMVAPSDFTYEMGSGGLPGDAREVITRGTSAIGAIPEVAMSAGRGVSRYAADLYREPLQYITGGKDGYVIPEVPTAPLGAAPRAGSAPAAAPSAPTPASPGAAAAPAPSNLGPRISNVPASAPPATKQLAAVANEAMADNSTPATEAAAAAVVEENPDLGAAGKRPFSEGQRKRAATAYIDKYMEVGAPLVIKEYLRQGDFQSAIDFQKFLDEKTTKKGMTHMARAAFAATVGDFETFAEELFEGQSTAGYFGDTVKIDKAKSGFTKDDAGNITGARVVMVDEKTGTSFVQEFDSPSDFVAAGMYFASPEVQFEYWKKEADAARETALGATEKAEKAAEARAKSVEAAALVIFKAAKESINPEDQAMTMADAMAAADASIPGGAARPAESDPLAAEGAAPSDLPILRRP